LGKFLNFNITKLKQKTAVHEQSGLNISTWSQEEEAENPIWGKNSTILPYLEGKKVEITTFRP